MKRNRQLVAVNNVSGTPCQIWIDVVALGEWLGTKAIQSKRGESSVGNGIIRVVACTPRTIEQQRIKHALDTVNEKKEEAGHLYGDGVLRYGRDGRA